MKKLVVIVAILVTVIAMAAVVDAVENEESPDPIKLHLIAFAQDPEAEVEITAGDEKETVLLDAGVNYLSYESDSQEVSVLAYGDKITPRVDKGRDGEYYCMVMIQPPGESVGEQ